jgi:hypothetical protein
MDTNVIQLEPGPADNAIGTDPAGQCNGLQPADLVSLDRECRSYTRYLIGRDPSPYIIEKYRDFHQKMGLPADLGPFDRFLLSTSARSPLWARLTDCYGSVWRKNSVVRRKLVLTLALLESAPSSSELLDRPPARGPVGIVLRLGWEVAGFACSLAVASSFFAPVRFWMAARYR